MTVRLKILALATALLAILCAALFVSLRLQKEVHEEIATVTEYHLPLTTLLAETEAAVLDYQLNLARAAPGEPAASAEPVARRERQIVARLNARLDEAAALLVRAVGDARNDVSDRITLARMQGTLGMLRREVAPFEAAGRRVLAARAEGDREAADAMLAEFTRFERLVGPDLAALRRDLEALSADSIAEVVERQDEARLVSMLLFAAAAAVGFGLAGLMATRLAGGLRRLVAGAKSFETGGTVAPLPVTSRDEVGQLTEVFNHMVAEIATKDRIKDTFGKYVDPRIVASLIDVSGGGPVEQAERRIATVFFSDIAGFSLLSEQLTAGAIANLLNRWFALSAEAIRAHHGVLDKYIGDSVMAFWAPPFAPGDDHAAQACLAALAQRDAVATLRAELPQILGLRRQLPHFGVRMGLATGELVLGTIGGPTSKSYTAIGDVVNLASRLEGINKIYGTAIVADEETRKLARGVVETRELDTIVVGGKTEAVRIFEVVAPAGQLAPDDERLRERWSEVLDRYRARDWRAADSALGGCLEVAPEDGPALLFRERIARLATAPPAADWDGVWRMSKV